MMVITSRKVVKKKDEQVTAVFYQWVYQRSLATVNLESTLA